MRAALLLPSALPLLGCVAMAGPCDLSREPAGWRLACEHGGTAIVAPPSTLQTLVREPAASAPEAAR
jgi:hypothetical protein